MPRMTRAQCEDQPVSDGAVSGVLEHHGSAGLGVELVNLFDTNIDFDETLTRLASKRPIFHSEADFQFALAWQIQELYPTIAVRLETEPRAWAKVVSAEFGQRRAKMDIELKGGSESFGIELKYLKRPNWSGRHKGEIFEFGNGVIDHSRFDVIRDLVRLERYVETGSGVGGALIVLAARPIFWELPDSSRLGALDDAFQIHNGARLSGTRSWGITAGDGTTTTRAVPLALCGDYEMAWRPYSTDPIEHRALVIEVTSTH